MRSGLGEGRQILLLVTGRPEEEKPWGGRMVRTPTLPFPEILPPEAHPLNVTCFQLILADS